ncbi:LamG domain-containing protein [Portibacter lacus]|uniref:LamG-like jellyroll fold domain-containing protein n=1 Tax=Portibacter lacus TaxID=1099794 RepID=A0AA37WEB0_9BACT|nr:LamG domain-containing protein [Portibacter lacus]GLR15915.1 hypothetical protein GCM10007940_05300 [Portibacter lacus]
MYFIIQKKEKTIQFASIYKLLFVLILFLSSVISLSGQIISFDYSGGPVQQYTIPSGVTSVAIEVTGADGGSRLINTPIYGGEGATAFGILSVTPGDVLELRIGAAGANATPQVIGENGTSLVNIAPGGGDASAVYFMGNPLIVAGGGGGSGGALSGIGGVITMSGGASGADPGEGAIPGGVNGSGGSGGGWISEFMADAYGGGGGGGYLSAGAPGYDNLNIVDLPSAGPGAGGAILKGGAGGTGVDNGYGGAGGGGGYSGGGGASGSGGTFYPGFNAGGGGGSFVINTATNAMISAGTQGGGNGSNGQVIISLNCIPVTIASGVTSNAPICIGETLELSVSPSGQTPFTYAWSGPGGTIINGDTANPTVTNPVSGVYSVTVTNFCGSVISSTNVQINTPPVIDISGPYNLNTDLGTCFGMTDVNQLFSLVSATGIPSPQISIPFDFQYPVNLSTVTATASNVCGSDNATIFINVTDINPPIALCKNINIEVTDGFTEVTGDDIDNGSFDECGTIHPLYTDLSAHSGFASIDTRNEGLELVTLYVKDLYGNEATCEAQVNIVKDLCLEGDDGLDSDNGGLPDACDCNPSDPFNDHIILKKGENNAMDFDGVNDILTIPNNPALVPTNNNSLTFEAWIKPDIVSGLQSIASSANSLSVYNLAIYLTNNQVRVTATGGKLVTSNATLAANVWTHIAIVFTANSVTPALSKIEIYIDGELDNSLTDNFEPNNLGNPILLGNINGANWSYNGKMDEVRFWSSSRTIDQVQLYKDRELTGIEPGLETYFNFIDGIPEGDNTGITTVKDFSNNSFNASLSGFAQSGPESNWINEDLPIKKFQRDTLAPCYFCPELTQVSLDFDGIDDLITIDNHPSLIPTNNNSMTFEAWINPNNVDGFQSIVSSANSLIQYNLAVYLYFDKLRVTASSGKVVTSTSTIPTNSWTHIGVVFNANSSTPALSTIEIYINGLLDITLTDSFESSNLGNPLILGNINGDNWTFKGQMEEVRFWNDARTAHEINVNQSKELYGGEDNLSAYFSFNNGVPNGNNTNLTLIPDLSNNNNEGHLSGFVKVGPNSNWVSNTLSLSPPENSALHFDGVDDDLTIPNQSSLIATNSNAVTFEAWIYPEKVSGISMIYSVGVFPNLDHQIFLDGSQLLVTGYGLSSLQAATNILPFEWTHVAVVFDMTETRLYINGKLDNTRIQTLNSANQGFDISLGNQANGSPSNWNFLGKMDDVRMWNVTRSEQQIYDNLLQELTGAEFGLGAYYNFNSGVPEANNSVLTAVDDLSGNGNTASVNGFAKTGSTSNWVASPLRFGDFDADGTPDHCDNCIAPKELILENIALDRIYKATETITLGDGLTFPTNVLTLRAPNIKVSNNVVIPLSALIYLVEAGCEE